MRSKKIESYKKGLRVSKEQKDIIVGTLLGDGHLEKQGKGETFRLKIKHSFHQKEYVDWLYEKLSPFVLSPPKTFHKKDGYENYGFQTLSLRNFKFFRDQFYTKEGEKKIPKNIGKMLNPLSVAVWFMDNGSIKSKKHRGYNIHSLCFSKKDSEILLGALKKRYGIEAKLHLQRKYVKDRWRIYIPGKYANKFEKIIFPHILPFFKYKLVNKMPKE